MPVCFSGQPPCMAEPEARHTYDLSSGSTQGRSALIAQAPGTAVPLSLAAMSGFGKGSSSSGSQDDWVRQTRVRMNEYRKGMGEVPSGKKGKGQTRWHLLEEKGGGPGYGEWAAQPHHRAAEEYRRMREDLLTTWAQFEPQRHIRYLMGRPVLVSASGAILRDTPTGPCNMDARIRPE